MERFLLGQLAATLMLALSAGPCLAEDTQHHERLISEHAVRTASASLTFAWSIRTGLWSIRTCFFENARYSYDPCL
jgi:hypothetical protein